MIDSVKRKFSVFAGIVLLVFTAISEADSGAITLNPTQQKPGEVRVYQNAYVKISNTFNSALYDLTIIEFPSEKRVLSIADFQSGQSLEMSFSKAGEYKICYSSENDLRTCLLLDVLKAEMI
ncbi:hypothetical protein JYT60_00295 [bacterium AH-315-C08]|nr:hypothetical protein [bacterium AH-315-C08]